MRPSSDENVSFCEWWGSMSLEREALELRSVSFLEVRVSYSVVRNISSN